MWGSNNRFNREERGAGGPVLRDPLGATGNSRVQPYNSNTSNRGQWGKGNFNNRPNAAPGRANVNAWQTWESPPDDQNQPSWRMNEQQMFPPTREEANFPSAVKPQPFFQPQQSQIEPPPPFPPMFQQQQRQQVPPPPPPFDIFQTQAAATNVMSQPPPPPSFPQEVSLQQLFQQQKSVPPPTNRQPLLQLPEPEPSTFLQAQNSQMQTLWQQFQSQQPPPHFQAPEPTPANTSRNETSFKSNNEPSALFSEQPPSLLSFNFEKPKSTSASPALYSTEDSISWKLPNPNRQEDSRFSMTHSQFPKENPSSSHVSTWELRSDYNQQFTNAEEEDSPWYADVLPNEKDESNFSNTKSGYSLSFEKDEVRLNRRPTVPPGPPEISEFVANPLFAIKPLGQSPKKTPTASNNSYTRPVIVERNSIRNSFSRKSESDDSIPSLLSLPMNGKPTSFLNNTSFQQDRGGNFNNIVITDNINNHKEELSSSIQNKQQSIQTPSWAPSNSGASNFNFARSHQQTSAVPLSQRLISMSQSGPRQSGPGPSGPRQSGPGSSGPRQSGPGPSGPSRGGGFTSRGRGGSASYNQHRQFERQNTSNNFRKTPLLPTPKFTPYPPPKPAGPVSRNPRGILKPTPMYSNFVEEGASTDRYSSENEPGIVPYSYGGDDDDDDDDIQYLGDVGGNGASESESKGENETAHDFFSEKMVQHFASLLKDKSVEDQLESLINSILLAPTFLATRVEIVRELHMMLSDKYNICILHPYGADFVGVGNSDDSVNIFVDLTGKQSATDVLDEKDEPSVPELTKGSVDELLEHIQTGKNHTFCGQIVKRTNFGRINLPVISFIHSNSKVRCNIRLENYFIVQEAKIVQFIISLDSRISPLLCIIRYWSSVHKVLDTPEEDTRNRFITLLVVFFLGRKKIIPTMAHLQSLCPKEKQEYYENIEIGFTDDYKLAPKNENSVLTDKNLFTLSTLALLKEFFRMFATADLKHEVVSMWKAEFIPKENFTPEVAWKLLPPDLKKRYRFGANGRPREIDIDCSSMLCLQDFQDLTENLTLAIPDYDVSKFQIECEIALERLESTMINGTGNLMDIFKVTDCTNAETNS